MGAIEGARREFDMVENGGSAGDKTAMRCAVRYERIGVQIIDEFVDEFVVLFELVGECGSVAQEQETRCTCR
jgi:hypothetical protein